MKRMMIMMLLAIAINGCGGYYILTAPDQLTSTEGQVNVVIRLQRNDMFILALGVNNAAISYRINNLPERASYTDDLGYAGAAVPSPQEEGCYDLLVRHNDTEGEEISATGPVYVWDKNSQVIIVELDALSSENDNAANIAADQIRALSPESKVIYLTRQDTKKHPSLHDWLNRAGYPDGPILLWQRKRWHITKGKWNIPKIVIESRLVSQIPAFMTMFPQIKIGIYKSSLAKKAFNAAGLKPVQMQ